MGTTLNGQQIKNTYPGLIKTSNTGSLPATTNLVNVGDGVGNDSPLALGQAGVGVGTSMSTIEASSILEVKSTTKGMLPPRMTTIQRNAIASPVEGLTIYNTTTNALESYDGTAWYRYSKIQNFGSWYSKLNQTALSTGSPTIFEETDFQSNIDVISDGTNDTIIEFSNEGTYNIQFSLQFENIENVEKDIYIWLNLDGGQIDNTGSISFVPRAHGGGNGHNIVAWNYFVKVNAGQQVQLMWGTNDIVNVTMKTYTPSFYPTVPSAILTISQVE
jgi:hypothetical protein